MSKVYEPTTNLFALLAEGADQPQRRTKNAAKGDEQELTPKERAAAKAVQDAERKAKREAEKAKQIEAEKRRKAIELANAGMDGMQSFRRVLIHLRHRIHPTTSSKNQGS